MGALRSVLDALAGDQLRDVSAREQLDRVGRLLEARNRIDAELARADGREAPARGHR